MREPRRKGRPVVEDVLGAALALGDGAREDLALRPEIEDLLLQAREFDRRRNLRKHAVLRSCAGTRPRAGRSPTLSYSARRADP